MSFFGNDPNTTYTQNVQVQRHEIARLQQLIQEAENFNANAYQRLVVLAQNIKTQEDMQAYANLQLQFNMSRNAAMQHYATLQQMLQLANVDNGKQISEQARREIYHMYHMGRYNQNELAMQYSISQSAVSKIVNGPAPTSIPGVNPNGVAG